jgi:hypothetical protein
MAWSLSAQDVLAAETVDFCVNNVKGSEVHFSVHYKEENQILKKDSGQYGNGQEKCIDVPTDATNIELTVYKSRFIVWAKACTKSWPTPPEAAVHVNVSGGTMGVECEGL